MKQVKRILSLSLFLIFVVGVVAAFAYIGNTRS